MLLIWLCKRQNMKYEQKLKIFKIFHKFRNFRVEKFETQKFPSPQAKISFQIPRHFLFFTLPLVDSSWNWTFWIGEFGENAIFGPQMFVFGFFRGGGKFLVRLTIILLVPKRGFREFFRRPGSSNLAIFSHYKGWRSIGLIKR